MGEGYGRCGARPLGCLPVPASRAEKQLRDRKRPKASLSCHVPRPAGHGRGAVCRLPITIWERPGRRRHLSEAAPLIEVESQYFPPCGTNCIKNEVGAMNQPILWLDKLRYDQPQNTC